MKRSTRASRACVWCQQRKVKCDASITGPPCMQCRQQGAVCRFKSKNHKRYSTLLGNNVMERRASLLNPNHNRNESMRLYLPQDMLPDLPQHVHFSTLPFLELKDRSTLDGFDANLVAGNGCLSIPAKSLIDEFVKHYFLYVHPSAILVDEAAFWKAYDSDGSDNVCKIPLVLFQAMLFASTPYLDASTLQQCGFIDKRHALSTLYNRAKFLFEMRTEDRPRYLGPTALLLTFYTTAEDPQAANFWLARAVKLGKIAENQRKLPVSNGATAREQTIWKKRLWWSIMIRDRSLCLGLRREPQITSKELKYVANPITEDDLMDEICESRVYDKPTKQVLTGIFQEQCQLALLLTAMVSLASAPNSISCSAFTQDDLHAVFSTISSTKEALRDWMAFSRLPVRLKDDPPAPVRRIIQITLMYYHSACIDLAHYESMLLERYSPFTRSVHAERFHDVGTMLHNSMVELIKIMECFSQEKQFHGFPIALLAFLEMPLIIAAIDLKLSPSAAELETRRRRMEALGKLHSACGQAYEVADSMGSNTNQLLRLAYDFTRRLFLQRDTRQDGALVHRDEGRPRVTRAKTWGDAFLRFPRAYLMISTSVDYFLWTGKLPSSGCLPEFVRSTLPMGLTLVFEIELPWCHDREEENPNRQSEQGGSGTQYLSTACSAPLHRASLSPKPLDSFTYGQPTKSPDSTAVSVVKPMARKYKKPSINLNYFCLDEEPETRQPESQAPEFEVSISKPSHHMGDVPTPVRDAELWSLLGLVAS